MLAAAHKRTPSSYVSLADTHPACTPANDHRYPYAHHPAYARAQGSTFYEEFHPFGTTAYAANDSGIEVSAKRYRYIGKERDEETGLYQCGARYLAAWLGRWTAADPIGLGDGVNRYAYARGNPVKLVDLAGTKSQPQGTVRDVTGGMEWIAPEGSKLVVETAAGVQVADQVIVFDDAPTAPSETPPANDILAFPQNRTPQESFERVQAEHAAGQQVLDELPEQIHRSQEMGGRALGVGLGIVFLPVAIGEVVVAGSAAGAAFFTAAAVYDVDQLQAGIRELATGEPTPTGYNQAIQSVAEASGASPEQATDIAGGVELGTAGVFLVGGALGGGTGTTPEIGPPEPRSLGAGAAKRTKQGGKFTEPDLPDKTIVEEGGVEIVHYTRSGDHGPAHLHVSGGGPDTKIGQAGRRVKGSPVPSAQQQAVIDAYRPAIRKAVDQIQRWFRFENRY